MGTLIYGSPGIEITFEDRALAHLRVVLLAKLRRDEKFALSWDDEQSGAGHTIWLHPAIPLQFVFSAPAGVALNRRWVELLTTVANSGPGLRLVPEPVPESVSAS